MTTKDATETILVPYMSFDGISLAEIVVSGDAKQQALAKEESVRRAQAMMRRRYYNGEQYDLENAACLTALHKDRLPEHERLHAYSTQIGESIDFLADRLGEGWELVAEDTAVQTVLDEMIAASPQISAEDDEGDIAPVTDDLLRDAMVTGDVAAYLRWMPLEQRVRVDFWESERVEFQWADSDTLERVIRTEMIWAENDQNQQVQVLERVVYEMAPNGVGQLDCRVQVFWDNADTAKSTTFLGLARLPWTLLRAQAKGLRDLRGQSPMAKQTMQAADRMNATMQHHYQALRYNSHGNLAVIGDQAKLTVESNQDKVHKDIADVLTFPGGTAITTIELPNDTDGVMKHVDELKDEIVGAFGLARVDPETWGGLGGVSGYALEILNTRTESTFKRIRRQWRRDWTDLVMLALDITAWRLKGVAGYILDGVFHADTEALDESHPVPVGAERTTAFWDVDEDQEFPKRKIEVRMGSGYVVDHVMTRDDFTAGLVSQEEALRLRGYTDDQITTIMDEQDAAKPKNEGQSGFGGITGVVPVMPNTPTDTQAGATVTVVEQPPQAAGE
jgi:hypothetical protein